MEKRLFTCLIEEQNEAEAFVQVYWAWATHMGEAITLVLNAAKANGLRNPTARESDPFDVNNLESEVEPGADAEVFWVPERYTFPPEPSFEVPHGVIGSCIEGEFDIAEIEEGFSQCSDDGLITIEVNVDAAKLFDLYDSLLALNSVYKVFWYVLHSHWDDEEKELLLVNEALNSREKIIAHLKENPLDAIYNGFVTLTAYVEEGATNISISDHKRIIVRSRSELVSARIRKALEAQGYTRQDNLISIEQGIHHWHYRLPGSHTKQALVQLLKESGFDEWVPGQ